MNVSVIGTGYVGLVTGVCLADRGHKVTCVDVDAEKVSKIRNGEPPIYEAGLQELLKKTIGSTLDATTDLRGAVLASELTLIAVGTPFDGREIDLTFVREVTRQIGTVLREKDSYHVVVVKSTVVPGTTDTVVLPILEESSGKKAGKDFGVGMNPEFLTEGQAIVDFMKPDRIVLGGSDPRTLEKLDLLYGAFPAVPRVRTNNKTAEMIKYASNCMLATQISFANEMGNLCSTLGGVDIVDVMKGLHLGYYLRPLTSDGTPVQAPISSFLEAGCGFGGSCLPKDVKALVAQAEKAGRAMPLLNAVLDINREQPTHTVAILKKHYPSLRGVRVAILGLAFKPDTDDMRESPAIPIVRQLAAEGAVLQAYDPVAMKEARRIFRDVAITMSPGLEEALRNVDAAILVTRWDEFKRVPEILSRLRPQPLFIDGRRMLDKSTIGRYEGIGV
jgi:UDPglucose 6-dehydrogenase